MSKICAKRDFRLICVRQWVRKRWLWGEGEMRRRGEKAKKQI